MKCIICGKNMEHERRVMLSGESCCCLSCYKRIEESVPILIESLSRGEITIDELLDKILALSRPQ